MNEHPAFSAPDSTAAGDEREIAGLRESQRMLSSLLQNLPGIAFRMSIDPEWTVRFISAGCFRLTGYSPEDLIGNRRVSYESLTHSDDRAWVRAKIHAALTGRRQYDVVYRLITAEGLERRVWERGQGILDDEGHLKFLEGFLTDVTDRHHAEEQVRSQAALLDKARDAILVTDLEGWVTYCNQSAQELLGWESADCPQTTIEGVFAAEEVRLARENVLLRGEWAGGLAARGREDRTLLLESRWTLVFDEQGRPKSILMINTDVTEKKKLESQFLRAQRMETIGALAGGIAHDLNNILSPILTSAELIRSCLANREDQELVDIVEASANRGAEMVKQILVFARGAEGHRGLCDLGRIVEELERIIRETFPRDLVLEVKTDPGVWPVMADATQIHQLLLNLCVNARDAMPAGGTLGIRVSNHETPDAAGRRRQEVLLEVKDTGTGIPESIRDRIFDPFFTTKELGEGTGLGLSTVQVIVKNHDGTVSLSSEVDRGSTFGVLLPATPAGSPAASAPAVIDLPCGQGQLVLVVDDESGVRAVTQRTLENYGYRAVMARNGRDGLILFERHREEVAAVVTDIMMPIMDGPTMVRAIREKAPTLPMVAATGLVAADNLKRIRDAGVLEILAKPYTAETLLRTLAGLFAPPAP